MEQTLLCRKINYLYFVIELISLRHQPYIYRSFDISGIMEPYRQRIVCINHSDNLKALRLYTYICVPIYLECTRLC